MRLTGCTFACSVAACFLIGAGQASAKQVMTYSYSGTSFDGSTSTAGAFDAIDHLAVDQETHNVYVTDAGNGGVVDRFDPSGAAAPFSARSGESSIVVGEWNAGDLFAGSDVVVDNTGGPNDGNFYVRVLGSNALLYGFDSGGSPLPNFPVCGSNCGKVENWVYAPFGLGLSPDGTLWVSEQPFVGTPPMALTPIDPTTGSRSKTRSQMVLGQIFDDLGGDACCVPGSTAYTPRRMVFSPNGDVYVIAYSLVSCTSTCPVGIMKYDKDGNLLNGSVIPRALPSGLFGQDPNAGLALDADGNLFVNYGDHVEIYSPAGEQIGSFGSGQMSGSVGLAIDHASGKVFVTDTTGGVDTVKVFEPDTQVAVPDVSTGDVTNVSQSQATLTGTVDPGADGTTQCYFEYGSSIGLDKTATCDQGSSLTAGSGPQQVTATVNDIDCSQFIPGFGCIDDLLGRPRAKGLKYGYRLVVKNATGPVQGGQVKHFRNANAPVVGNPTIADVNTDGAEVDVNIDPQGGDTSYRVDYGTSPAFGLNVEGKLPPEASRPAQPYGQPDDPQDITVNLTNLDPDTTYYYQVTVDNGVGTDSTPVRSFHTFPKSEVIGTTCPNVNERQQTGAAGLLDCRAYELVSAADQGGYNVESDLAPGQKPFAGYPEAKDRVLYGVHEGGIPNSGSPTNRGVDPYIASRGQDGWTTRYVGIPANSTPSDGPFSSALAGADAGLQTFAFGGSGICSPCFSDGSTGMPLRLENGDLVQGMKGSVPVSDPQPANAVAKHLSAEGSHFIFGSTQKFETAGNSNGDVTIYDRDLAAGTTRVVSTMPGGATMTGGGIVELDVSADGSRILIGKQASTDAAGNPYYDLYMHVGNSAGSVAVADTPSGVRYDGMTADGTTVLFSTPDKIGSDNDTSVDLYRAEVGTSSSTVSRVSTGDVGGDTDSCAPVANSDGNHWNAPGGASTADCGIVAIAGGAGVASDSGAVYFLSPEQLDGSNGTANQPNLYVAAPGSAPRFVATLDPDDSLVRDAVSDPSKRNTADFQVNPTGVAVFSTMTSPSGYENRGHVEVYRYSPDGADLVCVSCPRSNSPAGSDASLASNGLSITDDGRVFFNSFERLVLRDANRRQDAYEWTPADGGKVQLVSTGTSPEDASLMSVTADGTDALFFTRERLVEQDLNGKVVKIYDARENGGFFVVPPQQPCKASDECHGPGTVAAQPPPIQTLAGTNGQLKKAKPTAKRCRRGFVRRHGRCVKRPKHRKHRGHHHKKRRHKHRHGRRSHG